MLFAAHHKDRGLDLGLNVVNVQDRKQFHDQSLKLRFTTSKAFAVGG
jgi:hypothetical protein